MSAKWMSMAFQNCTDYMEEADRLLHMSIQGVHQISRSGEIEQALANWRRLRNNADEDELKKRLEAANRRAEFAFKEIDRGFPLLHAHAVVGIWGALEAMITDFLLDFMIKEPDALKSDELAKVTIPLVEYEQLDQEDRMRFLLHRLEESHKARYKPGIAKFEAMLEVFGLSGSVDDDMRRTLYEMSHVRNIILHRRSIVDRRFLTACPWFTLKQGDTLIVTHEAYVRYRTAALGYLTSLIYRVMDRLEGRETTRKAKEDEAQSPAMGGGSL